MTKPMEKQKGDKAGDLKTGHLNRLRKINRKNAVDDY